LDDHGLAGRLWLLLLLRLEIGLHFRGGGRLGLPPLSFSASTDVWRSLAVS